ncbi:glycosyltransferase [Streptomyces sp. R-07]|uniref:glycosyltransferase n=1 Tax=unclassified Streptomyces TaxID=2593676 RepID=UPI003420A82C
MRFLFVSGGSAGAVFPITPLALAARNAGHEVIVGATENVMPLVAATGLPGAPITSRTMFDFMQRDRHGNPLEIPKDPHERNLFNGRGMARLALGSMEGLVPLVERWRPDVLVAGALSYAAPLVAHRFGLPWVRHALNMGEPSIIDLSAAAELAPELEEMGLSAIPDPDMYVEICPPGARRPDAGPAQFMGYVPFNTQRALEPWMYSRSGDRPRVLVSAGSRVTADYEADALSALVEKVAGLDVELLIAAPQEIADALGDLPENVRAGWLPLDVVLRTCDLLVHRAGGNTMLHAIVCGVPQLLIPAMPKQVGMSARLAEYGAAIMLTAGEDDSPENVAKMCRELLEDPSYRARTEELSREIAGLPTPHDVTVAIADMVRARAGM